MGEGFPYKAAGPHIDLLTGYAFPSGGYGDDSSGIRLLRGDNVVQGKVRWDDAKVWPRELDQKLLRYELKEGDIAIALDRTWVKSGLKIAPIGFLDLPALLVQRVARIRAKQTLDQRYLHHCIFSYAFEQHVKKSQTETAVPHISPNDVRDFKIPYPTITEQRRIAAVLDAWDEAIATIEKLIDAKRRRLTWLVETLCFNTDRCTAIAELASQTNEAAGEKYRDFPVLSCTKNSGLVSSDVYFGRQVYSDDRTSYKIVHPDQFAYATNHIEEGSIGLNVLGHCGLVSPMYTTFAAFGVVPAYLFAVLKTERMRREFERRTPASVNRRGGLRWSDFSAIEVPSPSVEQQKRITSQIALADSNLQQELASLEALRRQKRGLMQKLLTGEWRVPESAERLMPGGQDVAEAVGDTAELETTP